jgi:hypothetical protein
MAQCHYALCMETNKPTRVAQDADKFMLRLPEGLREKVADVAKQNKRSINAEFVARIEASFQPLGTSEAPSETIREITRHAAQMLANRDEHVRLLEEYFRKSAQALSRAVGLLAKCQTPPEELPALEVEMAGAQYFLGVVDSARSKA